MIISPEIFAYSRPERQTIDLIIKHDNAFVSHMDLIKEKDNEVPPAAMSLSDTEAQALMDRLWTCGLRPSEGSGSAGALSAIQYHLEDMRKLVFMEVGSETN